MKARSIHLLLVLISCFAMGCTLTHKYGPYSGKVVDAHTREPIEGAVVLMVFYTETSGFTVSQSKFIDAVEVLTNKDGEFNIPAKRIYSARPLHSWDRHGYVTIFKPSYGCYPVHKNVRPMFDPAGSLPVSQHVTIQLPRLRTREERLNMPSVSFEIPYQKQEKFIKLINSEMKELGTIGRYSEESFTEGQR